MAKIIHIQGNFIRVIIPLGLQSVTASNGSATTTVTEFEPNTEYPVSVVLRCGVTKKTFTPSVDGNRLTVEDNGSLPLGAYHIEVLCRDDDGKPMRFMMRTILEVVEATADGGTYDTDEMDAVAYYPVLKARESAVIVGDDTVTIVEGLTYGGDDDYTDDYADINANAGSGSIEIDDDYVTLTI